jgi:hypothetical protein
VNDDLVERLRGATNAGYYVPICYEAADEIVGLREALTALLAATEPMQLDWPTEKVAVWWANVIDARAVAAAVLGAGANLGDSGMGESGGVSDGPQ